MTIKHRHDNSPSIKTHSASYRELASDTIAAISTPLGEGGIGIVRVSGHKAIQIVDCIFNSPHLQSLKQVASHTIHYGHIVNGKRCVDEVLVSVMKQPTTYTRQDVVEINCHGGMVPLREVLELVVDKGARHAEPGEFTKRAYLNGRLDINQAQAVLDIVRSKTELSLEVSLDHLDGKFSRPIRELKEWLKDILARIEVSMDFPDYEADELDRVKLRSELAQIKLRVEGLLDKGKDGRILRQGLKTAILGKPNVGKSTLLNEFLQENRAIVTPFPGTTRDWIEEELEIGGIPFVMIDTAGLTEANNEVEKIGIERAKKAYGRADLILFLVDVSVPLSSEDRSIAENIKDKKTILLLNKIDLKREFTEEEAVDYLGDSFEEVVEISAKYSTGVDKLTKKMVTLVWGGKLEQKEDVFLLNIREKDLLRRAREILSGLIEPSKNYQPVDLLAIDIREVLEILGELTGENLTEEVIDRIFSNFCVGK